MFESNSPAPSKSARTRARISAAAVSSFVANGYADTTMRTIAAEAGVSVGNAYYYFPSKNHLVQELYERVQIDHAASARTLLAQTDGLVDRLRIVFETGLTTLTPYHRIAPGFLSAMIAPDSPLNPLSAESSPARDLTIALFRDAVDGATHRLPADITALLPRALFVMHLALVLRWTYDESSDRMATSCLLDAGLRLFALAIPFLRLPGVHAGAREMLRLITEVRS